MNLQKIKTHVLPKGFTLVELIVVITILAILGTIGFLAVGGYSSKARDSARIWDAAQISKSLDLSIVTAGDYPAPDNAFSVTYSGGILWYQGTIGNTVMQFFKSSISGGGLSKKPVDPLKNTEYTYSELAEGKAYQIKVDYEGDLNQTALDTSLVDTASAAPGDPTIAYIRGNFGGLTAKTTVGNTVFVMAIPSIISNTWSSGVPIEIRGTNALSGALLFNGQNLRAPTSFNPNVVVFTGSKSAINPSGLPSDTAEITNMMTTLRSTYSGSSVRASQSVSSLIGMNTGSLVDLWKTAVVAQLGGKVVTNTGEGGTCGTANGTDPATIPSTNLCASGTLSGSVTGTGPWSWTCAGSSGGSSSSCSTSPALYTFTAHTFTNCGTTGRIGPALSTCQSSYGAGIPWTQNTAYLNMITNGIQEWTVPITATYTIDTYWAKGGAWAAWVWWNWTRMKWDFSLTKWEVIQILVWHIWVSAANDGSGGGGTFVVKKTGNIPLVIAGGGGWASYTASYAAWTNASTSTSGTTWTVWDGAGGTGGAGGTSAGYAGPGGGFTWNGWTSPSGWLAGWLSFTNWGVGWNAQNVTYNTWGGFGGGGGTHGGGWGGGGGGGYSGGGASSSSQYGGGGGGSYNVGTNQTNTAGAGTSNGSVIITKL